MTTWSDFTLFLYIEARISGFVLFSPLLGRRNVPGIFRGGLILVLSVFVYSLESSTVAVPSSMAVLAVRMLAELALGYAMGMLVNLFLYIPQLAGSLIDTQMGMNMNQVYDAASSANLSVSGQLLNALMLLLFFSAGGHHTMLRIFLDSGRLLGYGAVHIGSNLASLLLTVFTECTLLAVKLALPVLAAELLGQVGMGLLMKVIPQINVFSINIELKILIGMALLLLLLSPFSEVLLDAEKTMLQYMEKVLQAAG
ncbi:MAG: flagellar biosynthetic protein FliR [Firmicutes bacterium]|nr:flagellar biosynthetic protein FliR [Bacillota bacterium]